MQTNLFGATDYKRCSYIQPGLLLFWEIKLNCVSYETIIKYGKLFPDGQKDLTSRVCQNIAHSTLDEALKYYRESIIVVEAADYILFDPSDTQEIGCIQTRKNSYLENIKPHDIQILCKKSLEDSMDSPLFKQKNRLLKRRPKTPLEEDHLKKVKKSDILVW